jgi:hypothetical protein
MPNFCVPARIKSMKIFPARCEETLQCSETPRKAEPVESVAYCAGRLGTRSNATDKCGDHSVTILQFHLHRTASFEYASFMLGNVDVGVLCQMEGLFQCPFDILPARLT